MLVATSFTRLEDFYVPNEVVFLTYIATHNPCESFPSAMVISGKGDNKMTVGSENRKFEQFITASSNKDSTIDTSQGNSNPIAFYREDLADGFPNSSIHFLVRAQITKFNV